ncbi:hypothetical protein TNCV_3960461 [Trichonephila clavipes]|nr:hypothetical protein TNCV_3960461 [Trichonephila clavipes]
MKLSQIVLSSVWCSKLRLTTAVHLALCRGEFRGPRSDTVRQVELAATRWTIRQEVVLFAVTSITTNSATSSGAARTICMVIIIVVSHYTVTCRYVATKVYPEKKLDIEISPRLPIPVRRISVLVEYRNGRIRVW